MRLDRAVTCLQEPVIRRTFEVTESSLPVDEESAPSTARVTARDSSSAESTDVIHQGASSHFYLYTSLSISTKQIPKGRLLVKSYVHFTC